MRVALVAMPWATFDMPSPAVGALAAYLREHAVSRQVDCLYEYVEVWSSLSELYEPVSNDDRMGELLYSTLLYAENRPAVRRFFTDSAPLEDDWPSEWSADEAFDRILSVIDRHADDLAARLAHRYDVVGFTTSYAQLFGSLAVSQRLKSLDPSVHIVLGGMGVPYHIGSSVLRTFPFVDVVVQGEGERRFLQLLRFLEGDADALATVSDGVLTRRDITRDSSDTAPEPAESLVDEIGDLDGLPVPDFTEYAALADSHRIHWYVPIEASRGCWWDRVKRTGDPMDTCYFCSLNTSSYRHKSVPRVTEEIRTLSERHENLRFIFLDNIVRPRGVEAFADAIRELSKDIQFTYELRAQMRPRELLALKEAGCDAVQIGVEGLSASYLKRLGKGTTTIQNLQVMKTCFELGIRSGSNLITHFPGATPAEIAETAETIRRFASAYQPTEIVKFSLYVNSSVYHRPQTFAVENIRNADAFRAALPDDVYDSLDVYWLDYDERGSEGDWSDVRDAVAEWRALHERLTLQDGTEWFLGLKPLIYRDGGTFLTIADRRRGLDLLTLREPWRSIYLFCTTIRSRGELHKRFGSIEEIAEIDRGMGALTEANLIFTERGHYLSLAVAARVEDAARRIRASA